MKQEVFIAYTQSTSISLLKQTLENWDTDDFEPVAVMVRGKKQDLVRRVAAEGIALSDYLIAELGSKPGDEKGVYFCRKGSMKVEKYAPN